MPLMFALALAMGLGIEGRILSRLMAPRHRVLVRGGLAGYLLACWSFAQTAPQAERSEAKLAVFELLWQAPPGCPERDAVAREIESLTADSVKTEAGLPLAAQGHIAMVEGGFALSLTLADKEGSKRRTLEAPACEELGKAAALIVALAIDPSILERRQDPNDAKVVALWAGALKVSEREPTLPPAAPTPSSAPPAAAPQLVARHHEPRGDAARELPYRMGFGLLSGFGVLPGYSLGGATQWAYQRRSLRLEATASRLTSEANSVKNSGGAHFELYRLAPKVCWLVAETAWSAGPCASIETGAVVGKGYGLPAVHRKVAFWWASAVGGMIEWRAASSAYLGLSADLGIPLRRDSFELAHEELYRPRISGSLLLSLSAGWP